MSLNRPQTLQRTHAPRLAAAARAVCVGLFVSAASLSTSVHAAGFDSAPEVNAADKAPPVVVGTYSVMGTIAIQPASIARHENSTASGGI